MNGSAGSNTGSSASLSALSARRLQRKLSEQYELKIMATVDEFVQKVGGNRVIKTVRPTFLLQTVDKKKKSLLLIYFKRC
jgi:hypothetical protein